MANGGVEEQRLSWEILDAFRDAADQVGIPKIDDFNRGDNEGCGYLSIKIKAFGGVRLTHFCILLNHGPTLQL